MQMRAGGEAGRADVADDLSLLDLGATPDALGKALHMGVQGAIAVPVLDDYRVAVIALESCQNHPAVIVALDRCPVWCALVHGIVRAYLDQEGRCVTRG